MKVKAENVQDDMRVKKSIMRLEPLDYVAESKDLIQAISKY